MWIVNVTNLNSYLNIFFENISYTISENPKKNLNLKKIHFNSPVSTCFHTKFGRTRSNCLGAGSSPSTTVAVELSPLYR